MLLFHPIALCLALASLASPVVAVTISKFDSLCRQLICNAKFTMLEIPGKSCGPCSFCCKVLEIDHFDKRAGVWCVYCAKADGCGAYATRPEVCRDYQCRWKDERSLGPQLRPDRTGTLFMDDPDSDEYHAVCDPEKPFSWRNPLVFKHLVSQAKQGRVVVAKAGLRAWRIFTDGRWQEWV